VLDPHEMLAVAQQLISSETGSANDAQRRRAVSTAYYAVFHATLQWAADRFVGPASRDSAAYTIFYRGFSHTRMAEVCKALDRDFISKPYQNKLKRDSVSKPLRSFCGFFVELQDHRHQLDYDPQHEPDYVGAELACYAAMDAIRVLSEVDPDELADVLALMVVGSRS